MMSSLNILLFFLWLFSAVIDYSDFCYIWQLKEYRLDRMRDFMSTERGRDFWKKYILFWRSLIAIIIFLWPINTVLAAKYFLIALLGFELIRNCRNLTKHRLIHPVFTKKALLIIGLSLCLEGFLFIITKDWTLLLLLMILRFFILSFVSIILILPSNLAKKILITKAAKKINEQKKMIVIGITGSYGKTSVKTFLSHILSKKFRVIKTPKNTNTEIGIASFILKTDFTSIDIFVVEMGAYKMGEIKMICDMVKPSIGVLTAITYQHLSLFGDITRTQKAKYELLRSLPVNGLAVVNIDNKYCREFLSELQTNIATFGVNNDFSPTCLIKDVTTSADGITCSGLINNKIWNLIAPLVGAHNAINLAPCLLIAHHLGMTDEEITEQCKTLELPDKTMKIYHYGKSTIIDDSYNANYDGFCAALDTLAAFSNKFKIVITNGIPELGQKSFEIHEKIGEEIAYNSDILVVVNKDFYEPLRKGAGEKFNTAVYLIEEADKLQNFIDEFKDKDAVILIESRIPKSVYEQIISKK